MKKFFNKYILAAVVASFLGAVATTPPAEAALKSVSNSLAVMLNTANTWLAAQTFTNSDIRLLGSSTGYTTLTSANNSGTNYTLTIPARNVTVGTTTGTLTNGDCVSIDGSGNLIDAGGACSTGGGGGTVNAGTTPQLAYYATSGSAVSGAADATITAGALQLGIDASAAGTLGLSNGSASGHTVTIQNLGATSAYNYNLPTTAGAVGSILTSGGGVSTSNVWLADAATGSFLVSGGTTTIPAFTAASSLSPAFIGTNFTGTAASLTAGTASAVAASGITGTTLASGVTASSLTSFGASIALGTPASGVATNLTGTATALNIGGSAAKISISGQTGLMTFTGLASTNRIKTIGDTADTILELGGSYTPTGTWTNMTMVTPALGTPASGVMTNVTGTAASLTAGNATKLATARAINGQNFDGSAAITVGNYNLPRTVQASTYAPTTTDNGSEISFSGASANATWTIAAGATNGAGWNAVFNNPTLKYLTIKVTTNTIDGIAGATGFIMYPGEVRLVQCDGTNYFSTVLHGFLLQVDVAASPLTFTVPPGYQEFEGEGWGAGGGGSASASGAGGGGGGYNRIRISNATMGSTTQTVTVGAGAAATQGGNSSIGSIVTFYGGGASTTSAGGGGGGGGTTSAGANNSTTTGGAGGGPNGCAACSTDGAGGVTSADGHDNLGGGGGNGGTASVQAGSSFSGYGGGGGGDATSGGNGGNSIYGGAGGGGTNSQPGTSINGGAGGATTVAGSVPGGGGGRNAAGGAGRVIIRGIE